MILVGNQRGGAYDLAAHLMKPENDHVEIHELRGFMSEDLHGAFQETYAISKATKCTQYLFSLSLNPPQEAKVSVQDFENAIDRVETDLGLTGQPRAIVFHEKEGRRHAHAVWSRIDPVELKAKQLSFSKNKMQEVSRDLYLEHGWKMPCGLSHSGEADPRNYTLEQWQQAKRQDKDPVAIKTAIQDAWAISDSKASFTHALQERGYYLARGDRRGFLAVDHEGTPYSLSKWSDVKPKNLKARLGETTTLPNLEETKATIQQDMHQLMDRFNAELQKKQQLQKQNYEKQKQTLIQHQRQQRAKQRQLLEQRQQGEALKRQERFRSGFNGLWDRMRGEHSRIQQRNELEALQAMRRDQALKDELIFKHLEQRKQIKNQYLQAQQKLQVQGREIVEDRKAITQTLVEPANATLKPTRRRKRQTKQKIDSSIQIQNPAPVYTPVKPVIKQRSKAQPEQPKTRLNVSFNNAVKAKETPQNQPQTHEQRRKAYIAQKMAAYDRSTPEPTPQTQNLTLEQRREAYIKKRRSEMDKGRSSPSRNRGPEHER